MSQESSSRPPMRAFVAAALALLLLFAGELILSIRQQSQTIDESVHMTLCQVLLQMNRGEEGQPACQEALSIAKRVHPDYQFLRVRAVREIAATK